MRPSPNRRTGLVLALAHLVALASLTVGAAGVRANWSVCAGQTSQVPDLSQVSKPEALIRWQSDHQQPPPPPLAPLPADCPGAAGSPSSPWSPSSPSSSLTPSSTTTTASPTASSSSASSTSSSSSASSSSTTTSTTTSPTPTFAQPGIPAADSSPSPAKQTTTRTIAVPQTPKTDTSGIITPSETQPPPSPHFLDAHALTDPLQLGGLRLISGNVFTSTETPHTREQLFQLRRDGFDYLIILGDLDRLDYARQMSPVASEAGLGYLQLGVDEGQAIDGEHRWNLQRLDEVDARLTPLRHQRILLFGRCPSHVGSFLALYAARVLQLGVQEALAVGREFGMDRHHEQQVRKLLQVGPHNQGWVTVHSPVTEPHGGSTHGDQNNPRTAVNSANTPVVINNNNNLSHNSRNFNNQRGKRAGGHVDRIFGWLKPRRRRYQLGMVGPLQLGAQPARAARAAAEGRGWRGGVSESRTP